MRRRVGLVALAIWAATLVGACSSGTEVTADGVASSTTYRCPSTTTKEDDGPCGIAGFDKLHSINMRYANHEPFSGSAAQLAAAYALAAKMRTALKPLASISPRPTFAQVKAALGPVVDLRWLGLSYNAVSMQGTAFGLEVPGGCVFGQVILRDLQVNVSGYVGDGGCLASYGH